MLRGGGEANGMRRAAGDRNAARWTHITAPRHRRTNKKGIPHMSNQHTPTTRDRRLEMALELLRGIVSGSLSDLDQMKRFHPPSKRGSNYTRNLESLEARLAAADREIQEALS
jgi:hypothetical protein